MVKHSGAPHPDLVKQVCKPVLALNLADQHSTAQHNTAQHSIDGSSNW